LPLILLTLTSVALADAAKMKALIVGTWSLSETGDYNSKYTTFQEDGTMLVGVHNVRMKWEIKNGVLTEFDTPETEGVPRDQWLGKGGGYWYHYTILFLTKHELLLQDTKDKSIYEFMSR
jgi:hypothetical protein